MTPFTRPALRRRDLLAFTGLAAGSALLSACGGDAKGSDKPGGKVNLTFWLPGGEDKYLAVHQDVARKYAAAHKNVSITVRRLTGDQNFLEVLLARIAAGNPPSATVLWDTPVALGVRGSLMPLDDFMANSQHCQTKKWPEAVLKSCQFDGKTYGLPFTAGSYGMYFNQEWFEKLGIPADRDSFPKSWDEIRALSKEFTRWKGDQLQTAGFVPNFDQYTIPIWSALNGGQIFDAANSKYTIDSEQNVEMMEYFLSWIDDEYHGDLRKVQNSWTTLMGETPPIFQEQRQAMVMDGTWMVGSFYQVKAKFERWEVATIPVGPGGSESVSGYWPNWMAIPTASNSPEEAFKYLDHIAVDGAEAQFNEFPDLPTNAEVAPDIVPSTLVKNRGEDFAQNVTAFFRDQLDVATPMWDSPVQTFANDQLARALERISTKTTKPKEALAQAQKACQAELEKVL